MHHRRTSCRYPELAAEPVGGADDPYKRCSAGSLGRRTCHSTTVTMSTQATEPSLTQRLQPGEHYALAILERVADSRPRHLAPLPQTGPGPRRLPHGGGGIGRRCPKGRKVDQDTRTRVRLCLCSEGAAGPARIREMGGERSWVPILRCAEGDAALGRPIPRPLGGAASQPSRCGRGVSLLRSGGAHAKADDEGGETEKGMGGLAAPGRCYGTRDAGEVS